MVQSPSQIRRMTVKELVQQQRDELYATGHQALKLSLSETMIEQIDLLKKQYKLKSRDAVVARIIRKCMETTSPEVFVQRASDPDIVYRCISPIVANELVDYVKQIQRRFRSITYGPVFEMIAAEVGNDLSKPAVQLELIQKEQAVSG